MISTILDKAKIGVELTKDDALELLCIVNTSPDYYRLLGIADSYSRKTFGGRGYVFGQIGINAQPCSVNCRFCSLAKDSFEQTNAANKPLSEVITGVERMLAANVDEVFLMTTADYSKEQFLQFGAEARKIMPESMRLVANIGDFDLPYAKQLKEAGFTGVYHICRLGEGTDTEIAPEIRIKTLNAVRDAGLELYYCVEPINPRHTYEQLVTEMLRIKEYPVTVMAAMRMVPVHGTPLETAGLISSAELAKIVAVTTLTARPSRAMGVHEPNPACLLAGANQIYAEFGVNPRDTELATESGRGLSVQAAQKMLADFEWNV